MKADGTCLAALLGAPDNRESLWNRPVKDQFYGDRSGTLIDPFGHMWPVGTHVEDVSPEEMRKRLAAMSQAAGA